MIIKSLHFFPAFLYVGDYLSIEYSADLGFFAGVRQITLEHFLAAGTEIGVKENEGGVTAGLLFVGLPTESHTPPYSLKINSFAMLSKGNS